MKNAGADGRGAGAGDAAPSARARCERAPPSRHRPPAHCAPPPPARRPCSARAAATRLAPATARLHPPRRVSPSFTEDAFFGQVHIPMAGLVESLNVAVCAAVGLAEVARQRAESAAAGTRAFAPSDAECAQLLERLRTANRRVS